MPGQMLCPAVNFFAEGEHRGAAAFADTMHGQLPLPFPALGGPDAAVQIGSDLFPGIQQGWGILNRSVQGGAPYKVLAGECGIS